MKKIVFLLLVSSSLFSQEVFWQSYLSVEHPISGASDTAWFGIGDVSPGYNPYLDSLFYGNHDSLQDIRILGFDNPAYDVAAYEDSFDYDILPPLCGDLHRNIKPLSVFNPTSYVSKFHFMVWVDESDFVVDEENPENSQYAFFGIDTQAWQHLLSQNVSAGYGLQEDSVILFYMVIVINIASDFFSQHYEIINNEIDDNWWRSYSLDSPVDSTQLIYALDNTLCPPSDTNIRVYHILIGTHYKIIPNVGLSAFSMEKQNAYPNPTTGMLYGLGHEQKQLYTLQGKLLLTNQEEKIDLSPYPPGIYLLQQQHQLQRIFKY